MKKIEPNILSWCKNPDTGSIQQAINISKHPYLIGHVCLMPDAHEGYGMPIGGVACLKGAVSPNMVGVDIGCGVLAIQTSLKEINIDELKDILGGTKKSKDGIRKNIPVGFEHHKKEQLNEIFEKDTWDKTIICRQEYDSAKKQIGTLGGGNHFIEIQKGDDKHIWFMVHSGSRNLGFKVASYYNKIAEEKCKELKDDEVVKNELAYLIEGTEAFDNYIREMNLCLRFAYSNRQQMAQVIKNEFIRVFYNVKFIQEINIHHNYASLEEHLGTKVWVHRKGAILVKKDTLGIVPGSQGTSSYIVKGLGNENSYSSCSHGAGRKMSRNMALKTLDLASEQRFLDEKGILHELRYKRALDEAPSAYKDIDEVMKEQKDLVETMIKLTPLAVVKG